MEKNIVERPNVLYVDDIETNLILFEATFKNDFNVSIASSGKDALNMLREKSFSVLVSDQSMPGMTGTELMEIVKNEFPDIMRFILTAFTDYKTVVDSINKGEIYGFFNKPFDPDVIKMSINKAIEVYNLRISNRKMVTELENANAKLHELDKSKTRYLNILTNEIRTPINKIMSAIHMLKDRIGSTDLSELLFYLDTSVSRLESFSFAANQLSRLNEENTSEIERKEVSLRELMELCVIENKNLLDKFQTVAQLDDQMPDIKINGESELLIACLSTLLMNSLKHTEKNGAIRISCGESEEGIFLEIIDQGFSYSKNQIDNISCFFTDDKKTTDFIPGIELILAKQIMISHGGYILLKMNEDTRVSTKMVFPSVK
jgi:signal transduction histidine kinase